MKAGDKLINTLSRKEGVVESTYWVDLYDGMDYSPKRKAAKVVTSSGWTCGTLAELRQDGWKIR